MIWARRLKVRERRAADDWLRSATGTFVPEKYAWRAEQLCSPKHRSMLAHTLRQIEKGADERRVGPRLVNLAAIRANHQSLKSLVTRLELDDQPVSPAGMLRVIDLITDGRSPLYGRSADALANAIAATIQLLEP